METEEVPAFLPNTCRFCDKHSKPLALSGSSKSRQRENRIYERREHNEDSLGLSDAEGNSLQCDADNGGEYQQAQLLVPADKLNMAWWLLQEYKEIISPFSMEENNFVKRVAQAHPAKINIPMAATHHNLDLIKGLSLATTWKNRLASIRQPPPINQPPKEISMTSKNQRQQSETFKISQQKTSEN